MDEPGNAIAIITPSYNENTTVIKFLESLDQVLGDLMEHFYIIAVNDSSIDNTEALLKAYRPQSKNVIYKPISLSYNVGHQHAIYQGMLFASQLPCDRFIIMDSDGEDNPQAIPEMLDKKDAEIVKVARGRRNESLTFRVSYRAYRLLFKLITGKQMDFGNYCMINKRILHSALSGSFIHFPAFISRQKAQHATVKWDREKRIDGRSKMNMQSLLYHAFKSFIEYAEDLLMLFFRTFIVISIFFLLAMGNVLYQKFIADTAILGWTSVIAVGLLNIAFMAIGFFILGILLLNITGARNHVKGPNYKELDIPDQR